MSTIRIPKAFYCDHEDRDLPTPKNIGTARSYVVVNSDDPFLTDLLSDAQHYADEYGPDCSAGLRKSAAATAKAILEARR